MNWKTKIVVAFCLVVPWAVPAVADLTYTQGSGTTIFDFICFTTKHCSAHVPINSSGTEIGTSSNPIQVTVANTGANATAVKVNVASGGIASGAIASGAVASGAVASGAIASGAYASGSIGSGAMVDFGAQADSACGSDTGTCSQLALIKRLLQSVTTLNSNVSASIPAGTNLIGDVNLRQGGTALSTTNGIYSNLLQGNAVLSATNPTFTRLTDGTNAQVTDPCQAVTKLYKAFSQTATAVLVTGAASKKTYVCSISIIAGAAEIFNLTAGTGSTCGTSTVAVMGSTTAANGLSLAANGGLTFGNGAASLAATTVNQDDLCLQQNSTSRLSGSITYVQL